MTKKKRERKIAIIGIDGVIAIKSPKKRKLNKMIQEKLNGKPEIDIKPKKMLMSFFGDMGKSKKEIKKAIKKVNKDLEVKDNECE